MQNAILTFVFVSPFEVDTIFFAQMQLKPNGVRSATNNE